MTHSKNKAGGKFRKEIGLFGGISLVAGMTIGSGIYYLGSYVLQRSEMSMGLALICWVIGGIVSILGGLCFAELGASMPVAGGMTTYLSKAYSPALGFINGFCLLTVNGSGTTAALAIACVTAFAGFVPMSSLMIKIIAVAIIAFFTWLNLRGVKMASIFQNITMVGRVVPLILVIALGLALGKETPELTIIPESMQGNGITSFLTMIAFTTFASLWAYDGWIYLNTAAEEMKNPKKHLPLSIIISLSFITIVYALFNFAIYKVLPMSDINALLSDGNIYLGNEVAIRLMGNFGYWVVLIGMTIGIIGTLNGGVLVFPRTYYAMAKAGYLPKMFKNIDKNGVPRESIILSSLFSMGLVMFQSLEQLTSLVVFTSALLNVLTIAAVLIFRKKYPDLERPYKVWGGVPTVVVTIVLFSILLVNEFISNPGTSMISLIVPAIGYCTYLYFKKKNGGVEYSLT
ncbi:MAG: APC family permease [Aminipila sp.]